MSECNDRQAGMFSLVIYDLSQNESSVILPKGEVWSHRLPSGIMNFLRQQSWIQLWGGGWINGMCLTTSKWCYCRSAVDENSNFNHVLLMCLMCWDFIASSHQGQICSNNMNSGKAMMAGQELRCITMSNIRNMDRIVTYTCDILKSERTKRWHRDFLCHQPHSK